jgi:hypothetical protein
MMNQESISFNNDTLIVARDEQGNRWVAVRPICDALGIASNMQLAKLRDDPRFSRYDIISRDSIGRPQEMVCIPVSQLNAWLFGINSNRVKPESREKLLVYQAECAGVLFQHFMPQGGTLEEIQAGINNLGARFDARFDVIEPRLEHLEQTTNRQQEELEELRFMLDCALSQSDEDNLRALVQLVKNETGMDKRTIHGHVRKTLGVNTLYRKATLAQVRNVLNNMIGRGLTTVK